MKQEIFNLASYINKGHYEDLLVIEEKFPLKETNELFKNIVSGFLKRIEEKKTFLFEENKKLRGKNVPFIERKEIAHGIATLEALEIKYRKNSSMLPYFDWVKPFDLGSIERIGVEAFIVNFYSF